MAYDIYGNNLKKGCCEVHPHVHEEYPCSLCYSENREDAHNSNYYDHQKKEYERVEAEYYRNQWCMDHSLKYRILMKIKAWIEQKILSINSKCPF